MKLQVCMFIRSNAKGDGPLVSRGTASKFKSKLEGWESGFACVKMWGMHDVEWIIDSKGNKVEKVWDYILPVCDRPGMMAYTET